MVYHAFKSPQPAETPVKKVILDAHQQCFAIESLQNLLNRYVGVVLSGAAGQWDAETKTAVGNARNVLKEAKKASDSDFPESPVQAALQSIVDRYVGLAASMTTGKGNPETELEVIKARAALESFQVVMEPEKEPPNAAQALENLANLYVNYFKSGDAGSHNPENEPLIRYVRQIAAATKTNPSFPQDMDILDDALDQMLEHYVSLSNSGDFPSWDVEDESEVIDARRILKAYKEAQDSEEEAGPAPGR